MEIFKHFKTIFKKNNQIGLVDISNLFPIPQREHISDIRFLNKTKSEYEELLKDNIRLSKELDNGNMHEEVFMYTELLLNNLEISNQFDYVVTKLKLYLEEIRSIYKTLIIRLVALDEIKKEKPFLSLKKKNAIINAMNAIQLSLITLKNQLGALEREIKNFKSNEHVLTLANEEQKAYLDRKKYLRKVYSKSSTSGYTTEMIISEMYLEKYVYHHKDEINEIRKQLQDLKASKDLSKQYSNIINLENRFMLFYLFGRNLISKREIQELYNVKLKVLLSRDDEVIDSQSVQDNYFNKNNLYQNEQEVYEKIIMEKLNNLIKGESPFIKTYLGEYYTNSQELKCTRLINAISDYLRDENSKFDYIHILSDKIKRKLLLSLDNKDGLNEFFSTKFCNANLANCFLPDAVLSETIPLSTYIRILNDIQPYSTLMDFLKSNGLGVKKLSNLSNIYEMFTSKNNSNVYEFPDGFTSISQNYVYTYYDWVKTSPKIEIGSQFSKLKPISEVFIDVLRFLNKNVLMPPSLKNFEIRLVSTGIDPTDLDLRKLEFQSGIKKIKIDVAQKYSWRNRLEVFIETLIIPASVEELEFGLCRLKIKKLVINDFEESILLDRILHYQDFIGTEYQEVLEDYASIIYAKIIDKLIIRNKSGQELEINLHEIAKHPDMESRFEELKNKIEAFSKTIMSPNQGSFSKKIQ